MPALPLDEAGKYVAAAYVAFAVLLMVYVAIMAARLSRLQSEISELTEKVEKRTYGKQADAAPQDTSTRSVAERIAP